MAWYNSIWTILGIWLIQTYALATDTDKVETMSSNVDKVADSGDHNLHKRYIDTMSGNDNMGYLGYPGSYGYFQDTYGGFPEKRHASRWALIHRKLAELENSKRYNYPMESGLDDDKRSPSRWRFIHDRLKQLNKREAVRDFPGFNY